jgi:hypothetical protein
MTSSRLSSFRLLRVPGMVGVVLAGFVALGVQSLEIHGATLSPCPAGEVRDMRGSCRPGTQPDCPPGQDRYVAGHKGECASPSAAHDCPPGQVHDIRGNCRPRTQPDCPPGQSRDVAGHRGECASRSAAHDCPPGEVRGPRGNCARPPR